MFQHGNSLKIEAVLKYTGVLQRYRVARLEECQILASDADSIPSPWAGKQYGFAK